MAFPLEREVELRKEPSAMIHVFEWGGDWYAETATVRYEPAGVRSGKVVLHYRFHKL